MSAAIRETPPQAPDVPEPSWHALPPDDVARAWDTDARTGLSAAEAARRLAEHGPNRLPAGAPRPAWRRLLAQFHNPLIHVLLVAAAVTLALGHAVDTVVILGVVLVNALIGHVQEGKAERALDAVRDMLASQATVIRDGERRQVDAAEVVPGDLVLLESGDRVPADLRLVRARNLRAVESALTGESVPVEKTIDALPGRTDLADRANQCFSGTLVAFGQGLGIAVATGPRTEIGRIGTMVGEVRTLATPLTRRLDQFARRIAVVVLVVGAVTMAWGHWGAGLPLLDLFLAVVGLAVAAVPEGLPAVVTIVLAIGTRAMARNRAVVRRLPAVETLGSVSVICTDKTGTLTRNEMTAVRVVLPQGEVAVTGAGYAPEGGFHRGDEAIDPMAEPGFEDLARCALLCNDAQLRHDPDQGWTLAGDPTEGALVALARKAGLVPEDLAARWPRLDAIPFESERQYMATLHHDHAGRHVLLLKGAPERVFALCREPFDRAPWEAAVERAGRAGERVLALARAEWPAGRSEVALDDIGPRFELLGLVGLIDPPRAEAIAAVAECRAAGVRVKMITGDHAVTASAIAGQLGLASARTLTGDALDRLDDAALRERVQDTDVFARASPEHKLRLIAALQAHGGLVAMTGDGVNDAPALKAADIGVAMGRKGTDAAREASDLVLTDDNFATIARAVREGRVVYDNIKKSLVHMLPTNGGEAGVILLAIFAGLPLPVTPAQILWVNTVTSVTLALALAFEPAERGVMAQAPRPSGEPLVTAALGRRILFVVALMVAATFGVFHWELARGGDLATARTAAVNTLVACAAFHLFNVRHFTAHAFRLETLTGNPKVPLVIGILAVLQLAFTYAPPLQAAFDSVPLDGLSWMVIGALGAAVFLAVEAEKAWLRRSGVQRL